MQQNVTLYFQMPKKLYVSEMCTANIAITNPLSSTLTNGRLMFEGNEIIPGTANNLQK